MNFKKSQFKFAFILSVILILLAIGYIFLYRLSGDKKQGRSDPITNSQIENPGSCLSRSTDQDRVYNTAQCRINDQLISEFKHCVEKLLESDLRNQNTIPAELYFESPSNQEILLWSDAAAWGGVLPQAKSNVVIPEGKIVILDVSPPPLASLKIYGSLLAGPRDIELTVGSIVVYGLLQIGSELTRYQHLAKFKINSTLLKDKNESSGLIRQGGLILLNGIKPNAGESELPYKWGLAQFKNIEMNLDESDFSNLKNDLIEQKKSSGLAKLYWSDFKIGDNLDLELMSERGSWRLSQNAKDLNLFYVGYARCPDICPMTLSYFAQGYQSLDQNVKDRVQVLFISVDHENDTPQFVAEYAKNFDPSFVGLTGSKNQIDQAVNSLGASYVFTRQPNSRLGYSIGHSDRIFIVEQSGRLLNTEANISGREQFSELVLNYFPKNTSTQSKAKSQKSELAFSNSYVFKPMSGVQITAGYTLIENKSSVDATLKVLSADGFSAIELHETKQSDGRAQMHKVEQFVIPAKSKLAFEPGGAHIMLFDPSNELSNLSDMKIHFLVNNKRQSVSFSLKSR